MDRAGNEWVEQGMKGAWNKGAGNGESRGWMGEGERAGTKWESRD